MAKKRKGMMGALRDFFRWTVWGLAAVFAVAVYLNWTKDSEQSGTGDVAVLPSAASEETATTTSTAVDAATETAEDAVETTADQASEAANETAETADEVMTGDSESISRAEAALAKISIPGSDGTYSLLNAFRRDDGAIEFTIERKESAASTFEIRRITCAPLAVAIVASGDSAEALSDRNEAVELKRIPLGSAESLVAAAMCGAFS